MLKMKGIHNIFSKDIWNELIKLHFLKFDNKYGKASICHKVQKRENFEGNLNLLL